MSQQPLVSICIITYNQINYIHDVITSVLEQDYENIEIIIADDGSADGTAEVILDYAKKYPDRVIPLTGGGNLGITGNCNRALKACSGKYVTGVGGDDVLLPGKITAQVEALEEDPSRVLCCHPVIEFGEGREDTVWTQFKDGRLEKKEDYSIEDAIGKVNIFGPSSAFYRSSAIPHYGFDERLKMTSDWKFSLDVLRNGGKFVVLDKPLCRYRRHTANVTKVNAILLNYEALLTVVFVFFDHKKYFFKMIYPFMKQSYWLLRNLIRWGYDSLLRRH